MNQREDTNPNIRKYTGEDDIIIMEDIDSILSQYSSTEDAEEKKRSAFAAESAGRRRRTRRYEPKPSFYEDDSDEIQNTQILPVIGDDIPEKEKSAAAKEDALKEEEAAQKTEDEEIPNTEILPVIEEESSDQKQAAETQPWDEVQETRVLKADAEAEEENTQQMKTERRTAADDIGQKPDQEEDTGDLPGIGEGKNDPDSEPTKAIDLSERRARGMRINTDRTPVRIRTASDSNEFGKIPSFDDDEPEAEENRRQLLGMHDPEKKEDQEKTSKSRKRKNIPWKKILGSIAAVLAVAAVGAYGYGVYYYSGHFLPGTAVEDVRVDNMTAKQAESALADAKVIEDQTLLLLTKDGETVPLNTQPMEIRRQYLGVQEAIEAQPKWLFPINKDEWKEIQLDYVTVFNKDKAYEALTALQICDPSKTDAPKDAYVEKDAASGSYVIRPAQDGNTINVELLAQEVARAVENKEGIVDIEGSGAYLTAGLREDDPGLIHLQTAQNAIEQVDMKIDMGADLVYSFTPDELRSCLRDGAIEDPAPEAATLIDEAKFEKFMDKFSRTFNTKSASGYRNFLSINGTKHALQTDYGWEMDKETTGKQIHILFFDSAARALADPNYAETYPGHQITATWLSTAKSHGLRDTGPTWVEVDLTHQKLYCVVDDQVVVTTDIVSGRDSTPARRTPTGMYEIRFKTTGRYLTGYNRDGSVSYRSYVNYWMPFYNNIGLHDATWRYAFGGELYKNGGSHGCVNMPLKAAKEVYGYVYRGMPVIVYK